MILAKDKAKDLVLLFYYAFPNNGSTEGINSTTRRYQEAIRCAAYAVGTILDEYQSISDLESTLVVNGEVMSIVDKIIYWNEVEREIIKL